MQFENGHFKKCNDWLAERYGPDGIIDWNLAPTKSISPTPASDKENSSSLATKAITADDQQSPVDENTKLKSAARDEFDDADALEALVAAENEEGESSTA